MFQTIPNDKQPAAEAGNFQDIELIEQFLDENYEFRKNVISDKLEFRKCCEEDSEYRVFTEEAQNSLIVQLRKELPEAKSVKTMALELIHSEQVTLYDPIREYLHALPSWDGKNRTTELFARIPGITDEQIHWLCIWMRSTVAHWLGMDMLHGNECVPTLIGPQGCGKTTFCKRILPPHLRGYFLDHLNLSNKFDKEMALTNNLLVCLDELDQIRSSQHAQLKHTLSKSQVNGRPIYGCEQKDRPRYASFVATTNNLHPLCDPTGSRRYICVRIREGKLIDNETPIDYEQLFAQVVYELKEKEMRYWFTNEETALLQQSNLQFQQTKSLEDMIDCCFRHPRTTESITPIPMRDIEQCLLAQYPLLAGQQRGLSVRLGRTLVSLGYESIKRKNGMCYYIVPEQAA